MCKSCDNCYHLRCSFDNHETYKKLTNWQCDIFVSKHLPFANVNDNNLNMARHGFSDNFKDTLSNLQSFTIQSLLDKKCLANHLALKIFNFVNCFKILYSLRFFRFRVLSEAFFCDSSKNCFFAMSYRWIKKHTVHIKSPFWYYLHIQNKSKI